MRTMILLCACACFTACVTPNDERDPQVSYPDDEEPAAAAEGAPVLLDLRATDTPERIRAAALSASLTACHGYTPCPGVPIGDLYGVDCGVPFCTLDTCGTTGNYAKRKQPREYYRPYSVNGQLCLAYQPGTPRFLDCGCYVGPED